MGLFKKMKDILFDEEVDYTEQIKITPQMRNVEEPVKEETKEVINEPVIKKAEPRQEENIVKHENASERETYQNDSTFPFWDFDEDEFTKQNPVAPKKEVEQPIRKSPTTNVLEYEKRKRVERKVEYPTHSRIETVETSEKRKFKPSPVISPVYGILDKDYSKDDVFVRNKEEKIDVQSVRDKAFGERKETISSSPIPRITKYEETETVTISNPIEKEKKVKTIDELLENTADYVVDIDRDLEDTIEANIPDVKETQSHKKEELFQDIMEDEEKELQAPLKESEESDLFDLIDQMYDNKESD